MLTSHSAFVCSRLPARSHRLHVSSSSKSCTNRNLHLRYRFTVLRRVRISLSVSGLSSALRPHHFLAFVGVACSNELATRLSRSLTSPLRSGTTPHQRYSLRSVYPKLRRPALRLASICVCLRHTVRQRLRCVVLRCFYRAPPTAAASHMTGLGTKG